MTLIILGCFGAMFWRLVDLHIDQKAIEEAYAELTAVRKLPADSIEKSERLPAVVLACIVCVVAFKSGVFTPLDAPAPDGSSVASFAVPPR